MTIVLSSFGLVLRNQNEEKLISIVLFKDKSGDTMSCKAFTLPGKPEEKQYFGYDIYVCVSTVH